MEKNQAKKRGWFVRWCNVQDILYVGDHTEIVVGELSGKKVKVCIRSNDDITYPDKRNRQIAGEQEPV